MVLNHSQKLVEFATKFQDRKGFFSLIPTLHKRKYFLMNVTILATSIITVVIYNNINQKNRYENTYLGESCLIKDFTLVTAATLLLTHVSFSQPALFFTYFF